MRGQPIYDTRPHARLPPSFLCMDDLTTERSFDLQATWVIDVFGLCLWHVIHSSLYNQSLTDVLWTGTGIKCLYCTFIFFHLYIDCVKLFLSGLSCPPTKTFPNHLNIYFIFHNLCFDWLPNRAQLHVFFCVFFGGEGGRRWACICSGLVEKFHNELSLLNWILCTVTASSILTISYTAKKLIPFWKKIDESETCIL